MLQLALFAFIAAIVALFALAALALVLMSQTQGLLPSRIPNSVDSIRSLQHNNFTRIGSYELLKTVPHDTSAFTQGLIVVAGRRGKLQMYESTGIHGASQLRRLDVHTGRILQYHSLSQAYFGEGIAHYRDRNDQLRLIQLTWKEQTAFEYVLHEHEDSESHTSPRLAEPVANQTFQSTTMEGWGVTYAAGVFYVTDGSEYLHTWDADTKRELHKVAIWYQRPDMPKPVNIRYLNELEWDPTTNTVLANVWKEDLLIRIDPANGFVRTIYDLRTLFPKSRRSWGTDVLNGVALTYDALQAIPDSGTGHVWVSGKYWPYMFRIRLIEPPT
jgi:glutaminyl-peptide cyclotransferase